MCSTSPKPRPHLGEARHQNSGSQSVLLLGCPLRSSALRRPAHPRPSSTDSPGHPAPGHDHHQAPGATVKTSSVPRRYPTSLSCPVTVVSRHPDPRATPHKSPSPQNLLRPCTTCLSPVFLDNPAPVPTRFTDSHPPEQLREHSDRGLI
ncbi:early nodulin-20-like [Choloepus didactylus]|uniref:early nodulin-20-like n=1 Tax=Choloepus didactylus TaxID=27675 RepID=UPI00189F6DF8|nr:early nodulin-20-like [Choloepus didactylus]